MFNFLHILLNFTKYKIATVPIVSSPAAFAGNCRNILFLCLDMKLVSRISTAIRGERDYLSLEPASMGMDF